ncbi:MAG: hypothetical protein J1F23_00850 [Oscillospiraceae bacterium]|nr:hypothetical protein [Oscillospiraceae bacterium]
MEKFIIAGLKTEYLVRGGLLRSRSEKYRADFDSTETQVRLNIKEEFLRDRKEEHPNLSMSEVEYIWTCEAFYSELLKHNGMMLHASCVEKDGYAYLFSAKSGTGKSTHTHLWLKNLPNTRIINDDKPALIYDGGKWYACGTPFSGKTDENIDVRVPVRAITFLSRGEKNTVTRLNSAEAATRFLPQTINPSTRELSEKMLDNLDRLLRNVPVFALECNMSDQAAYASYEGIERLINE